MTCTLGVLKGGGGVLPRPTKRGRVASAAGIVGGGLDGKEEYEEIREQVCLYILGGDTVVSLLLLQCYNCTKPYYSQCSQKCAWIVTESCVPILISRRIPRFLSTMKRLFA